jgi:hypothetical protein
MQSSSVRGVLRCLELSHISGGMHSYISQRIAHFKIDTAHFTGSAHNRGQASPKRKHWSEYLTLRESDAKLQSDRLRRALLESGRAYLCERCGTGPQWLGGPLTVEIDHISGDWKDNRPENLRFLCPNCHSQTESYCRRKKTTDKRVQQQAPKTLMPPRRRVSKPRPLKGVWPADEELRRLVWERPATAVAKEVGVSSVAVKKRCKAKGIMTPPRGHWSKT